MNLPRIEDVVFTHYHCDEIGSGDKIYKITAALGKDCYVRLWDACDDEAKAIEDFNQFLLEECKGLHVVSWNQSKLIFGPEHLNDRYEKLTGKKLNLKYQNHIDLSNYMWNTYGNFYCNHPRLDSLAEMNGFIGVYNYDYTDKAYLSDRLLLLAKIYGSEIKGELLVYKRTHHLASAGKSIETFLVNTSTKFVNFIKDELTGRRGKKMAVMIIALQELKLIAYDTRAELFDTLRSEFHHIGSDESINRYLRYELNQQDYQTQKQIKLYIEKIKAVI